VIRTVLLRSLLLGLISSSPLLAQTKELDLQPSDGWVDTGIDLKAGDTFTATATGRLQYSNAKRANGPEGLPRGFSDLVRIFQVNDAGRGTLIGRVGTSHAARPFLIGTSVSRQAPVAGHLFVAVNQSQFDHGSGTYHITIERTAATAAAAKADVSVPVFSQKMIDSIPRRVNDADNNPGDRVNFVVIGSQEQVQAALKAAGWVVVDKSHQDAVLSGLIASLNKQSYVTMPMSELMLFGRIQDFGYAQADPLKVVASRHHFRIWKAPFDLEGQTVWAGAGTEDIGFERDNRTENGITHKIDPNTDGERDYIGESLAQTGLVLKAVYITPTDPIRKAKTATGSEFTSDGRTLLIYLTKDKK
jgi:hypothetical protein